MRQRRHDDGSLVIVPATWVRVSFWAVFVVGLFILLIGVGGLAAGAAGLGLLVLVGLFLAVAGGLGIRMRVKVNHQGISYRFIGSASVLIADLDRLEIGRVAGRGSTSRAQVIVVRRDGSTIRLDPTIVAASGPQHDAVHSYIAAMYGALGLDGLPPISRQ